MKRLAIPIIICIWAVLVYAVNSHGVYYQYAPRATPSATPTPPPVSIFTQPSLVHLSQPSGSTQINSSACTNINDIPHWTSNHNTLNGILTTSIYIPAGCQIYLNATRDGLLYFSSNTTVTCAGDNVAGFYNQTGYLWSAQGTSLFWGQGISNFKIQGCVLSNTYGAPSYQFSVATYQASLTQVNHDFLNSPYHGNIFIEGGNDIIQFFAGDHLTVDNNLIEGNYAGEGILFGTASTHGVNYGWYTNNVVVNNTFNNALQITNSQNMTVSGNWVQNTGLGIIDDSRTGAGNSTGSTFNNTFTCTIPLSAANTTTYGNVLPTPCGTYQTVYGCGFGSYCDYEPCNYALFTLHNNTIAGAGWGFSWLDGLVGKNDSSNVYTGNATYGYALNACS